jgi:putative colanic acid biosynthesis acetyltransferase WcaF
VDRRLGGFTGAGYDKGRSLPWQAAWYAVQHTVFSRWFCPSAARVWILRRFGARVGRGVVVRRAVRVHWPWKLTVGEDTWIGEGAWLLNLEPIDLGRDVCVSQEALLCTGSHDRRSATFEFDNAPITVADGAWIAVRATVLRGVTIGRGAVVGACALVTRSVPDGELVLSAAPSRRGELPR